MAVFSFRTQFVPCMNLSPVRWSEVWHRLSIYQDKFSSTYIYSQDSLLHLRFIPVAEFLCFVGPNVRTVGSVGLLKLRELHWPLQSYLLWLPSNVACSFTFFFFLFNFIYRDLYLQDHPYLDVICTNSELTHKDDSDAISSWQQLVLLGCLCGKAGFVRINTRTDFQPDNDAIDIHC